MRNTSNDPENWKCFNVIRFNSIFDKTYQLNKIFKINNNYKPFICGAM